MPAPALHRYRRDSRRSHRHHRDPAPAAQLLRLQSDRPDRGCIFRNGRQTRSAGPSYWRPKANRSVRGRTSEAVGATGREARILPRKGSATPPASCIARPCVCSAARSRWSARFKARRSAAGSVSRSCRIFASCRREARFAANFAKLGIHPGFGLTVTLPRLDRSAGREPDVLHRPATERRRSAGDRPRRSARRSGRTARRRARARARRSRRTRRSPSCRCARPCARVSRNKSRRATEHELKEQQWLRGTEDSDEGIRAVAERRPGNFKGK